MYMIYDTKPYELVEVYCTHCNTFHEKIDDTYFPVAICPSCEENWNEFLDEYGFKAI